MAGSQEEVVILQGILQVFVDLHYCSLVATSVAVVGGWRTLATDSTCQGQSLMRLTREDGHHVPVLGPVVALHYQLMGTSDESQAIVMVESFRNVLAKGVASATRRYSPSTAVIGV